MFLKKRKLVKIVEAVSYRYLIGISDNFHTLSLGSCNLMDSMKFKRKGIEAINNFY